jgi:hypothetical protein
MGDSGRSQRAPSAVRRGAKDKPVMSAAAVVSAGLGVREQGWLVVCSGGGCSFQALLTNAVTGRACHALLG